MRLYNSITFGLPAYFNKTNIIESINHGEETLWNKSFYIFENEKFENKFIKSISNDLDLFLEKRLRY